jgi:hypothetical protein
MNKAKLTLKISALIWALMLGLNAVAPADHYAGMSWLDTGEALAQTKTQFQAPNAASPGLSINELTPGGVAGYANGFYVELAFEQSGAHSVAGYMLEFYELQFDGSPSLYAQVALVGKSNESGLFLLMNQAGLVAGLSDGRSEVQVAEFQLAPTNLAVVLRAPNGQAASTYNFDGTVQPDGTNKGWSVERAARNAPDQEGCWYAQRNVSLFALTQDGQFIYGTPLMENEQGQTQALC